MDKILCEILDELYNNIQNHSSEITKSNLIEIKVGNTIQFGTYPQSNMQKKRTYNMASVSSRK